MKTFQAALIATVGLAAHVRNNEYRDPFYGDDLGLYGQYTPDESFDYNSYYDADFGTDYTPAQTYHQPVQHYEPEPAHYYQPEPEPVHHYQPEPAYHAPEPHYEEEHHYEESDQYSEEEHHYEEPEPTYHAPVYEQQHYPVQNPEPSHYDEVPHNSFEDDVHDFNEWNEIWTQEKYESRVHEEAQLMVALEAIREAMVDLDYEIDYLFDCIDSNDEGISDNEGDIHDNDDDIDWNNDDLKDQQYQTKAIQKRCRRTQRALDEDRDALILFCQQFAFATDMVGPCADILTCVDTRLPYRADIFTGGYAHHAPEPEHYYEPEPQYHQPEPQYHQPEPAYHAPEPIPEPYHEPEVHHPQPEAADHHVVPAPVEEVYVEDAGVPFIPDADHHHGKFTPTGQVHDHGDGQGLHQH